MASTSFPSLILNHIRNRSANSRRQRLKESAAVESLSARRNRRMDAKEKGEMTMQKRTAASDLARSFNAPSGGEVIGIGRLSRGGRGRGWPLRRPYCCCCCEGRGPLCLIANKGGSRIELAASYVDSRTIHIQGRHKALGQGFVN